MLILNESHVKQWLLLIFYLVILLHESTTTPPTLEQSIEKKQEILCLKGEGENLSLGA
jgi:hypothetical protein